MEKNNNINDKDKHISEARLSHLPPLWKVHGASKKEREDHLKRTIAGKAEMRIIEKRLVY